ncbi:putative reverse transcriptase (RNA-dependent DNA polymerase) [Lyophyllum shimeji]|uniref:Reverse transcriptase (RNA-dependent DNA polymerase) n=1 Tax=Lyophyllum shimeji TaxID=47721 RepID=A0A9P3UU95_LYOSH|nr:putative reverse transcriptase (RNA-dependent DNA polymerase) [Lyophyllum shimeji]
MQLLGFKKTYSDPSLYIYDRDGIKVIVPVFLDDITLASKCIEALDKFVSELGTHFKLRDLGPTSYLLGIRIERETAERRIYLSQTQYIVNKLEEFGMTDCKPVGTPMLPGLKLSSSQSHQTVEEKAVMENIPYMNAVGSLLYLATMTRPDIAYAASVLARFNANPGMAHWKAVKHVFRYLKGTIGLKLMYGPNPEQDDLFVTFSNADLGGNPDNGRSTTGYMTRIGLGVVDWMSKLQPVVTLSTTESELVAGVTAGRGMAWIRNLVDEIGYAAPTPSKLFTDNMSAMQVSKNPEHHGRMKHLDLCWYWLREQVGKKKIAPLHLPTEEMPADLLTKALPKPKVEKFRRMIGLVEYGNV